MVVAAAVPIAAELAPLAAKLAPFAGNILGGIKGGIGSLGGSVGNILKGGIGSLGGNIGKILKDENLGKMLSGLGNLGTGFMGNKNNQEAYQAYQNYLNGISSDMQNQLEGRAEKYDTKLQNMFQEAEPQFLKEANTQLPELGQIVDDISQQGAEAQRLNRRQVQTELAQQGIRGGQATTLANRATGALNRDLQRDINQTVFDEASNRQNSRLNYYGQKSLTPWNSMASGYSNSMVGANNALSEAQGYTYKNAYNRAMNNYMNTQKKGGIFG